MKHATLEILCHNTSPKNTPALCSTPPITAEQVWTLFKTYTPGIVITDFNMPEMSGAHMVAKIRAIKPDTKFIVITGDTGQLALEDSDKKGFKFDHFIAKPVVFEALFVAIDQCLGEI